MYSRDGATRFRTVDRWDDGVGWMSHPDEDGVRATRFAARTAASGSLTRWMAPSIDTRRRSETQDSGCDGATRSPVGTRRSRTGNPTGRATCRTFSEPPRSSPSAPSESGCISSGDRFRPDARSSIATPSESSSGTARASSRGRRRRSPTRSRERDRRFPHALLESGAQLRALVGAVTK